MGLWDVTGGSEYDPTFSPDGEFIYFASGLGGIWRMRPDGRDAANLTPNRSGVMQDSAPTLSADSQYVFFASRRNGQSEHEDIFRLDLSNNNTTPITHGVAVRYSKPVTSRSDSSKLFCVSHTEKSPFNETWSWLPSPARKVLDNAGDPHLSPQDDRLAFVRRIDGKDQIFVSYVNGSNATSAENPSKIAAASSNVKPYWESYSTLNNRSGVRPLSGAFLMLTNSRSADEWASIVHRGAALRLNCLIIQTEAWLDANYERNPVDRANIIAVLDAAHAHNMSVLLGLIIPYRANGDPIAVKNYTQFRRITDASLLSLSILEGNQTIIRHPALAGFYLPSEGWTPSVAGGVAELGYLWMYISELSTAIKRRHPSKIVAMSPFVSDLAAGGGAAAATTTEMAYYGILSNSSVDLILVQDGVGARGASPGETTVDVPRFIKAFSGACSRITSPCVVWTNLESFTYDSLAAPWGRVLLQLAAATTCSGGAVTYELATYVVSTPLEVQYATWLAAQVDAPTIPHLPRVGGRHAE